MAVASTTSAQTTDSLAQATELTITFVQDTIVLLGDEIVFDVQFNNDTTHKISLFYAKDLCEDLTDDSSWFASGFSILLNRDINEIFCDYQMLTRRSINPNDRRMLRLFKRHDRQMKNGQLFCSKKKIILKPGLTTRQYQLSNFCKELPSGQYEIRLIYRYFRDAPIDCSCIKCYPKISKNEIFYKGKIVSDSLILIKR